MTVSQVSFGSHEPVLDVKNLTVKYIGDTRSTTAVDRVSFSIGTGKYAATRTLTVLPAPGAPAWFAFTGLAG